MTRRVFSTMAFPSAAGRCRLPAILCALLTLWAQFDSQVLLQASAGSPRPASPSPAPTLEDADDDDYVLDLTGKPAPGRRLRRNACPAWPRLHRPIDVTERCFSLSRQLRQLPPTAVCEHAYRNGLGAPLLC
jgi:hypothetical protein